MFSPEVVHQENFLEMPSESQALYFHLGLQADDQGFVSPKGVVRMVNANPDNLKVLIAKGFVIPFESGVVVITHWERNNFIRKDRFIPSIYQEELKLLDCSRKTYQRLTSGQPTVNLERERERKKGGEKISEKGEEGNEKIENDVEKLENTENTENTKKIMQEIRTGLGLLNKEMAQITASLNDQEPQG